MLEYNPYNSWENKHLEHLDEIIEVFKKDKPVIGGADTETTGLHIKRDKAFLIIFGWLVPGKKEGRVFTFYPTPENMEVFFRLAKQLKLLFFHNSKYDLHMLRNTGYEYDGDNLSDSMIVGRLVFEAVPQRAGGDSLALKDIGMRYVHPQANSSEKKVKQHLDQLKRERIKYLTAALKQFPLDGEKTATGKQKYWGKGAIEKFLKDPTHDLEDLPEDVREVWLDWQKEYPEPTYADVDREVMIQYAAEDVITMLEFVRLAWPTLKAREQIKVFKMENEVILPLYRMEQVGMKVDREYLLQSKQKMKAYIKQQRQAMYRLAGGEVNVGQHATIIKIFQEKWNIHLDNADKPSLKKIDNPKEAKRYAELIIELRTLEKWYTTYLLSLIEMSDYDGRAYTQISQCAAVSGRVGSNFQQYPKDAILDENGEELFHPRNAFIPTGDGYDSIWYCDLSQVELRVQANYTLMVSGGDLNMCRAYMPFRCIHYKTREEYKFKSLEDRIRWNEKQPNGKSAWIIPETRKEWVPTDVHSETTSKAFPQIEQGTEEFKKWRSKGKIFNFMRNYGGGKQQAMLSLDLEEEHAEALVRGYSEAFPHVLLYQDAVQRQHKKKGYVENMYGRRYYIQDTRKGYKLANYLVQGSAADDLKRAIIAIDKLLLNYKSRLILTVHDENQIEIWSGEEHLIPKILKIMGDVEWSLVPILCDAEKTTTNWREKYEVKI